MAPSSPGTSSVIARRAPASRWWRNPLVPVAGAVLVYAALCAAFFRASARGPDAFVVTPRAMQEADAPAWLPPAELARINALGDGVRGRSSADPDVARDLATCYEESPWVSRVIHVRRAYPNRLDVALAIRKPFAAVSRSSGPQIVLDRAGVRLPASADPAGLPRLTGASGPPPSPGETWKNVRVLDGLRVLERYNSFTTQKRGLAGFLAREVRVDRWSRPDGRPAVELVTRKGLRVVWGIDLPDGSASITGPSAGEKLAALARILPRLARERRPVASVSVQHRSGVSIKFAAAQ